jgi:prophage tail gpP-like protein
VKSNPKFTTLIDFVPHSNVQCAARKQGEGESQIKHEKQDQFAVTQHKEQLVIVERTDTQKKKPRKIRRMQNASKMNHHHITASHEQD